MSNNYKDWSTNDEVWNSLPVARREEIGKYMPMVARLSRFGYQVLGFEPGVTFVEKAKIGSTYDTRDCIHMDASAWEVYDKALQEIERLNARS